MFEGELAEIARPAAAASEIANSKTRGEWLRVVDCDSHSWAGNEKGMQWGFVNSHLATQRRWRRGQRPTGWQFIVS